MVVLIIVLWFAQRILLSLTYMILGKVFFKAEMSAKKCIISGCALFAGLTVDYLLNMKIHLIIHLGGFVLYSRFVYGQSWKKVWQGSIMLLAVGEVSELILLLTQTIILTPNELSVFDNTALLTFPAYKLNLIGVIYMFVISLILLAGRKMLPKISALLLKLPRWLRIAATALQVCVIGTWYWLYADSSVYGGAEGFFAMAATFFLLISLSLSIFQEISQSRLEKRNRLLGATQESIASFLFETRAFRHDIANMMYGWQGVLLEGDIDKIREFNSEIRGEFMLINNENALNLQKIDNGALRELLSEKARLAEQNGVALSMLVEGVYERFKMNITALCRVMGILADNAINAARECEYPSVHIHIFQEDGRLCFLMRNTAKDDLIEKMSNYADFETEYGYTAIHGIGLKSAHELISKYPKANLSVYTRGRYVEACLALPL